LPGIGSDQIRAGVRPCGTAEILDRKARMQYTATTHANPVRVTF